jgi:hypothetical protein
MHFFTDTFYMSQQLNFCTESLLRTYAESMQNVSFWHDSVSYFIVSQQTDELGDLGSIPGRSVAVFLFSAKSSITLE